jgi:hypothetical protein
MYTRVITDAGTRIVTRGLFPRPGIVPILRTPGSFLKSRYAESKLRFQAAAISAGEKCLSFTGSMLFRSFMIQVDERPGKLKP